MAKQTAKKSRQQSQMAKKPATALANLPPTPEKLARIDQVFKWIVCGRSETEIVESIAEKWPGESPRELISSALDRLAASAEIEVTVLRGWALEAFREVYRRALLDDDLGSALRAIERVAGLAGV